MPECVHCALQPTQQVTHWKPASGQIFQVSEREISQFLIRKQSMQPGALE